MKDLSLLISCPGGIHIIQPSFEMQARPLPYARYVSTSPLRNFVLQTCPGPSFDGGVHTLMSLRHRTRLRGVSGLIHFVPGATSPTRKVSRGGARTITRSECYHTAICTTLLFICDENRDLRPDSPADTSGLSVSLMDLQTTSSCSFQCVLRSPRLM
jgi:hypothetical protein